ncbi:enoyl-CoA hydratase/isomerase family protein [Paenarthrobacter sp. Z7-10]|uniref:enoyl-CoA hydratase/isomerase family protein n=1 Tax=Paenarthrobacter sp. Z7-10 TaxID=2787635 RepID=UPI0022A99B11|nr:enoyl-CoA hydratase/isomerase family protein [Paenarthrobacter sp. Z7-10]MCZ2402192.1 enoyl-CoA hydratase/isomerase family protein [Paenarthrobacter sp. Z7-10]
MTSTIGAEMNTVDLELTGSVATLTLGTGERLNAMGRAEWRDLGRAAAELAARDSLRAVVIRGRGGMFCAGSDLREWDGVDAGEISASFAEMETALQAVEDLAVPTVAVLEGVAAGGGCQLALACDLQLTAQSARIGMPVARLGILVPASFANRLSLRVGPSRAKDLLYSGRLLTAQQAVEMGLITTVIADDGVEAALESLLTGWEGLSAASLRASKAAVDRGLQPVSGPARREPQGLASDPREFSARVSAFLHRRRR